MNIVIEKWYGGVGNNIIQLKNAIGIAIIKNYNIILPENTNTYNVGNFVNKNYIIINCNINKNCKKKTNYSNMTIKDSSFFVSLTVLEEEFKFDRKEFDVDKIISILKECLTIKNIPLLHTNDLVIHIRSGDIFKSNKPHTAYVQPPLCYYKNIIDKNKFNNISIVSEDDGNPCINELLKLYPNIYYKKQSLEEDIKTILGSKNIVCGFGTFASELLLLSDNLKNLYIPSYWYKRSDHYINKALYDKNKINDYISELDQYYKEQRPWKNTDKQKDYMIYYII